MLQRIADVTHGEYFLARSADKVMKIYQRLGRRVIFERAEHEVTALFTALGMFLALGGGAFSLFSHRGA